MRRRADQLIAVVDIGSNSVRLVVYKGLRRNPVVFFNERVICGLGSGIGEGGELAKGPVEMALKTLERFAHLCADMQVDQAHAVATAAVRDAVNREMFVRQVRERCGFEVEVLSGEEEAHLSALGALTGFPGADGIVGDMGGSSLELVNLVAGEPRESVSLPIGPLRLADRPSRAMKQHRQTVKMALNKVAWLAQGQDRPFYMVGGAWRALARLHMLGSDYPLMVHHAYELSSQTMRNFAKGISRQHPSNLGSVRTISSSRMRVLPLVAMTLELCLKAAISSRAIVSATGLREGLLYGRLPEDIRNADPYLAACLDLANETGRFPEHADSLMDWLDPLFKGEGAAARRVRLACCMMSDISWRGHADFRAAHAFHRAFEGHFVGVSHSERAQTALALYISYGGAKKGPEAKRAMSLLGEDEIYHSRLIGLGLRLGQLLTGGTAQPLKTTRLEVSGKKVVLTVSKSNAAVVGGGVEKRLAELAAHLGCGAGLAKEA
jgi:exopolyphosphatase/guanosine-5'-triphosphate,3'-diphosphate pyrophosphatase